MEISLFRKEDRSLTFFALHFIYRIKVVTINSESTEVEDIKKTISDVGLEGVENINYLQAINRVIGWINNPLAN